MTPDPTRSGTITIPRWIQLAGLPVLLIILWFFLGAVGEALFIFLCASFIALVLNPLVRLLERIHVYRAIGVFVVYLVFVAALVGIGVLVVPVLTRQVRTLIDAVPDMISGAQGSIDRLQSLANHLHLGVNVRAQVTSFAGSLAKLIPSASKGLVGIGMSVVRLVTISVVIIVVSIYMLLDGRRIGRFFTDHFPTHSRADGAEYVTLAQGAVVSYVKAQILLSAALGFSAGLAMWLLNVVGAFPSGGKYAVFFGVWAAVMEAIPYIGPVMAAVPPVLVALFHSPVTALWVIIAFLIIQEVEGHILVPLIMGTRFRVHPLIVIFAVLAGQQIHGITGMFLAIPLIPLARETLLFFSSRVKFERWPHTPGDVSQALLLPEEPPDKQGAARSSDEV
ncbi:MAG: AI-2E family transporter [Thermoleophilia bacterium]